MDIVVNEELKAYIDPLTPEEYEALERSILAEGCRDALVLWGDVLVDGHNRYGICRKHGLSFQTVQNPRFKSFEDVHLWMIDQHLGRRSVSDFQRGVLALRKREIVAGRRARAAAPAPAAEAAAPQEPADIPAQESLQTREALAKAARLSSSQVLLIEKIQKQGAPELVAAVKAGAISINAAAAVATLPVEEQAAAATVGAEELKQAAKRVRESRRKPPAASPAPDASPPSPEAVVDQASGSSMESLQQRIAQLEAENSALRQELAALRAHGAV
ncbi:plasmid replication/partition related protein [Roseateles saccharophilus]|uniref:Basic region leucine zipper protein n=1 Tax=Roseateles saccharophilus TaxID=304 RepID=A0A4R3USA2_ROSSA|nr:plasmid replication/partition related protein [Roseateles saccharophilus]MDG0836151.1 plasmid replication/partition related protein [Roseateles saccharophilus]TCU93288.1 basic region leucine zipper protein [Roseateles saccharophilus]